MSPQHVCPVLECGAQFHRPSRLREHIASRHNDELGGAKPYACTWCPKSFMRQHDLRRHMLNLHNVRAERPPGSLRDAEDRKAQKRRPGLDRTMFVNTPKASVDKLFHQHPFPTIAESCLDADRTEDLPAATVQRHWRGSSLPLRLAKRHVTTTAPRPRLLNGNSTTEYWYAGSQVFFVQLFALTLHEWELNVVEELSVATLDTLGESYGRLLNVSQKLLNGLFPKTKSVLDLHLARSVLELLPKLVRVLSLSAPRLGDGTGQRFHDAFQALLDTMYDGHEDGLGPRSGDLTSRIPASAGMMVKRHLARHRNHIGIRCSLPPDLPDAMMSFSVEDSGAVVMKIDHFSAAFAENISNDELHMEVDDGSRNCLEHVRGFE